MRLPPFCPSLVLLAVAALAVAAWPPAPAARAATTATATEVAPRPVKLHPKLDGRLNARLRARAARGLLSLLPAGLAPAVAPPERVRAVAATVKGDAAAARAQIEAAGGTVEIVADGLVQFTATLDAIERLADAGDIRGLREPYSPMTLAVVSEGVGVSGAPAWRQAGYTGRGLRIGVLDAGFAGYQGKLGSELPASVTTYSARADRDLTGGGEVHGAAVAEIVHDMAPDADLVLVNYGSDLEFATAVNYLRSQQVDIITNSTGSFVWGPGDGTGAVNQAVTAAVHSGVFWAQAAGNHARRHWAGRYTDSDGDGRHNFTPDSNANAFSGSVAAGTTLLVYLKWDDAWDGSCTDYDLYLFDPQGRPIVDPLAQSTGAQTCTQDPVERIVYTVPTSGVYSVVVSRYDGDGMPGPNPNARLDLFSFSHNFAIQTAAGSLAIPGDNALAATVGAHHWASPSSVESYSSQGPTLDGRLKPDLTGPDGVANATYGSFFGTSAATPHVAGAAALVKQAHPDFTPAQTKEFLMARAADILAPGADTVSGAGRLALGTAPAAIDPATAQVSAPVAAPPGLPGGVPVTVTVRDVTGAPAVGKPLTLSPSRATLDRVTPDVALTDRQGRATFTVLTTTAGPATFSARAVAEEVALGSAAITFFGGTPRLTITPTRGPSQRTVQLQGAEFAPNLPVELRWNAAPAAFATTATDAYGAFSMTASLPPGQPGQYTVRAVQGLLDAAVTFTVVAPELILDTAVRAPGGTVVATGADFYPLLPVALTLDGVTPLATQSARDDGTLAATLALPGDTPPGPHTVEAVQAGVETLRAAAALTVVAPPLLASVAPQAVGQGAAGRTLTLRGSGFAPDMTVTVSGSGVVVVATSVTESTTATIVVDVALGAAVGPRSLTLRNRDGGASTLADALTVNAAPSIASLSPVELTPGGPAVSALVTGSGFDAAAIVAVGGVGASVSNVTVTPPNRITFDLRADANAAAGPRAVTVTNPDGGVATVAGAVRVLGQFAAMRVTAAAGDGITVSFTPQTAAPNDGRVVLQAPATASLVNAAVAGVAVAGQPCVPGPVSASATTLTLPVGSCQVTAGAPVALTVTGVVLPPAPAAVAFALRTETAVGVGLDAGTATLWQPLLSMPAVRPAPGERLLLSGRGFPPVSAVAVRAESLLTSEIAATADANGGVMAVLTVPAEALPGPYPVVVQADGAVARSVVVVAAPPTLAVTPPGGAPASTFRLMGKGFVPGEVVSVRWDQDAAP